MIEHLDDLEADFLRFFQVDDIYQLDGPRFMRLAWRVSAYRGVIHMRLQDQEQGGQPAVGSAAPVRRAATASQAPGPVAPGAKVIPLSAFMASYPGAVERRGRGGS